MLYLFLRYVVCALCAFPASIAFDLWDYKKQSCSVNSAFLTPPASFDKKECLSGSYTSITHRGNDICTSFCYISSRFQQMFLLGLCKRVSNYAQN